MKPRKPKLCKHCGEEFVQYTSLDKYCSQRCQKKGDDAKAKEKRKIAKIAKGLSISVQKKKLWSVISEYIRRKYADSDGKASCVTCGDRKHWKELQAGHFCPSGSSSYLRYVESNIHPQCYRCNINLGSNPIEYREFMIREYGEKFVDQMLSLRNEPVKFSSYNIQVLRETWEDKLRNLGEEN